VYQCPNGKHPPCGIEQNIYVTILAVAIIEDARACSDATVPPAVSVSCPSSTSACRSASSRWHCFTQTPPHTLHCLTTPGSRFKRTAADKNHQPSTEAKTPSTDKGIDQATLTDPL
jgi:hypothetical protein